MRGARISPRPARALLASVSALTACDPKPPANAADATTAAAPTASAAGSTAPGAPPTSASTATPPAASPGLGPWRYGPALTAVVPAGTHAEPVLELADGVRGRARIVVAVAGGDRPVRLEVWDFSQNNERGLLTRLGDPEILLDLGDVRGRLVPEAVATLCREMAMPGRERVRPLGLPGEPAAVVAELARLASESITGGDAATRSRALALFIRGVDDTLLWDDARLAELLRRLQNAPWVTGTSTPLGARRVRISATEEGRPVQLELARTQDRWALVRVVEGGIEGGIEGSAQSAASAPAAEPSPTAP